MTRPTTRAFAAITILAALALAGLLSSPPPSGRPHATGTTSLNGTGAAVGDRGVRP